MAKKKKDKQVGPLQTFEIRKFVKAHDIVEAFNLDVQTPPSYLVQVSDEVDEEVIQVGFNER